MTSRFQGFDLNLWLLTFRGHLRSKIFLLFESLYKTSYLISYWHFLSCTFPFLRYSTSTFLRFDLDFWLFKSHLRSKIFPPFESPYMTSYLISIDTFYLVPFSKVTRGWRNCRRSGANTWCPIGWHFLSISYRLWKIRSQSFWGFYLDHLTFRSHLKSKMFSPYSKAHIYMTLYLTSVDTSLSLYLVPFSKYSTLQVSGFDLDLWISKVTRGWRNMFSHSESPYTISLSNFCWHFLSISYRLSRYSIFKVSRVWPWHLTFRRSSWNQKYFLLFESL